MAACVITLPFCWPYWHVSTMYGLGRTFQEVERGSARWRDFFNAGPANLLYAPLAQRLGNEGRCFFPGVGPLLLAGLAVWRLRRAPPRVGLLLATVMVGVVMALGVHTPLYRCLYQTGGFVLRAMREPEWAVVLCYLALGVLAAWGLALLVRPLQRRTRLVVAAGAVLLTMGEYAAVPLRIVHMEIQPAPVYRWLSHLTLPGAVIEWPLSWAGDADYVLRSTAHWQPLINGFSSFAPPHYRMLEALLRQDPIPPQAIAQARTLGACLLIFHDRQTPDDRSRIYRQALRDGLQAGQLEPLTVFPNGLAMDYVFRIAGSPAFDTHLATSVPGGAAVP